MFPESFYCFFLLLRQGAARHATAENTGRRSLLMLPCMQRCRRSNEMNKISEENPSKRYVTNQTQKMTCPGQAWWLQGLCTGKHRRCAWTHVRT
jgi:hypothetical protein